MRLDLFPRAMDLLDARQYVVAWGIFVAVLVLLASLRATAGLALGLAFLALFGTATLALGLRPARMP